MDNTRILSTVVILQGFPIALCRCFFNALSIFDWESISPKSQIVMYGFHQNDLAEVNPTTLLALRSLDKESLYEECIGHQFDTQDCIYFVRSSLENKFEIFDVLARIPIRSSSTTFIVLDYTTSSSAESVPAQLEQTLNNYIIETTNDTRNQQIDSSIYFVVPKNTYSLSKCIKFKLYEFYFIKHELFLKEVSTQLPINFYPKESMLVRRQDFQGTTITAVAQQSASSDNEVKFSSDSNLLEAKFEDGVAVEMYWNFRDMLNFTEKARIGSAVGIKNDKPSGLTYDLLSNDSADVSISQITVKMDRAVVLQFLQPTLASARIKAIFRQPRLSHMRNIFLAPFTYTLWITIGITWIILLLIMIAFSAFFNLKLEEAQDLEFVHDAYVWVVAAICQKGWTSTPVSNSMRSIFLTGCFTGLIIYVAYSAVIVATLSVEHVPIKSFSDLLAYKFRFYAHELSYTMQNFVKLAIITEYNLTQSVLTTNTVDEVRILLRSSNALVSYEDVFYSAVRTMNYTDDYLCQRISLVNVDTTTQKMAMFTRKESPLIEYFNYKILMMKERGFVSRYLQEYTQKTTPVCGTISGGSVQFLDLADLYVAFCFVLVGIPAGLVAMLLEKLTWSSMMMQNQVWE